MAKIVVVSADVDARELIVFALRFAGHQVKSVSSVRECIEKVRQFYPDLLLLDDAPSEVNEIEANRYIKSHEITASIPLVLFTLKTGNNHSSNEGTEVGDMLIMNGISPDQLTDKVNSIVNRLHK